MVKLVPISFQDLRPFISLAFEGDTELLEKYHVSPGDLEHCVEHTLLAIEGNFRHFNEKMEFYAIISNNEIAGYTVIIRHEFGIDELYSFGVNMKYRTKNVLISWVCCTGAKIRGPFYIVLWSKNTRAIDFFERNGFTADRNNTYLNDTEKTLILCQQEG